MDCGDERLNIDLRWTDFRVIRQKQLLMIFCMKWDVLELLFGSLTLWLPRIFSAAASSAAAVDVNPSVNLVTESELIHIEWVQELPEDLDVCIAQRDFEGAVDLIQKSK